MERPNIYIILTVGHRVRLLLFLVSVLYFITFIIPNMVSAWELAKKQNEITVYTRHVKGSNFKEYKAVTNIKASLSSMVAIVDDVEAYPSWIHTCKEGKLLKRVNEKETYNYTINDAPWPVRDRDAAVHNKISQNPEDRVIIIEIRGIPRYIPEKTGLQRVEPHAQARGTSTFFGGTRRSISAFAPIGLQLITLPRIHPRASPWLSA